MRPQSAPPPDSHFREQWKEGFSVGGILKRSVRLSWENRLEEARVDPQGPRVTDDPDETSWGFALARALGSGS